MIEIVQLLNLRFIAGGIPLEPRNSFLDALAKTGADFITIAHDAIHDHGRLRSVQLSMRIFESIRFGLKFFSSLPMVAIRH